MVDDAQKVNDEDDEELDEEEYTMYSSFGGPDPEFDRLRRKRWYDWQFVLRGEWSESPWHQGNYSFYIAHNKDKTLWAIRETTARTGICIIAATPNGVTDVASLAEVMLEQLADWGGPAVEFVHDYGDL